MKINILKQIVDFKNVVLTSFTHLETNMLIKNV